MKQFSYQPRLDQSQTWRAHQQQKTDWEQVSETEEMLTTQNLLKV